MNKVYLIKFGGSIITNKARQFSFRKRVARRLCREIKEADIELEKKQKKAGFIITIGGGSFGHGAVKMFGLEKQYSAAKVREAMHELVLRALNCMLEAELNAVILQPSSFFDFEKGKIKNAKIELVQELIENFYLPVFYGDVFFESGKAEIISGDDIICFLGRELKKEGLAGIEVVFVSDVSGIYKDGKLIESVSKENLESIFSILKESEHDVTGGIKKKIETIIELKKHGINALIINGNKSGMLKNAILGKEIKTTRFEF